MPYLTGADPNMVVSGESTMGRGEVVGDAPLASGALLLSFFTARKTETIGNVRVVSGSAAAGATPTLVRVGVYQVTSSGGVSLVASTPNDTSLLAASRTAYTRALSASWKKTADLRYALGVLVVTSQTVPNLLGQNLLPGSEAAQQPRLSAVVTGLTDLPATVLVGALGSAGQRFYGVVAP